MSKFENDFDITSKLTNFEFLILLIFFKSFKANRS